MPETWSHLPGKPDSAQRYIHTQDAGETSVLRIGSAIAEESTLWPHGYQPRTQPPPFTRTISITNSGDKPIQGMDLLTGARDLSTLDGVLDTIGSGKNDTETALRIFQFIIRNTCHASSGLPENNHPIFLLNFFGFGLCGERTAALSHLLGRLGIPCRRVPSTVHTVHEYLVDGRWIVLDPDLHTFYPDLDNGHPASGADVLRDPFLIRRVRSLGPYAPPSQEHSAYFSAVIERLRTAQSSPFIPDASDLDDLRNGWDLFPGEQLVFHRNAPPPHALCKKTMECFSGIRESCLRSVELIVPPHGRRPSTGNSITIRTKFPIVLIRDQATGKSIPITDTVVREVELPANTDAPISILCQASQLCMPRLTCGENAVTLRGSDGRATIEFCCANHAGPPRHRATVHPPAQQRQQLLFPVTAHGQPEAVHWQISPDEDFTFVPPHFDRIAPLAGTLRLDGLDQTLLAGIRSHHIRIRAAKDGVWSAWNTPLCFSHTGPDRPRALTWQRREDTLRLSWDTVQGADSYAVFASDRMDFMPGCFLAESIDRMEGPKCTHTSPSPPPLATTTDTDVVVQGSFAFYRVVAFAQGTPSPPSDLIRIPSGNPTVLQARLRITEQHPSTGSPKSIVHSKPRCLDPRSPSLQQAPPDEDAPGQDRFVSRMLEPTINAIDMEHFMRIRQDHAGAAKVALAQVLSSRLRTAHQLNMQRATKAGILELDTGFAAFAFICTRLGHAARILHTEGDPLPAEFARLLGLPHTAHTIHPLTPLPRTGVYDLVTALDIGFNQDESGNPWAGDEWDFFLGDIARSHTTNTARIFLNLDPNRSLSRNEQDLAYFESRGARIIGELCILFDDLDRFR